MAHEIALIPSRCLACGACELACALQWRLSRGPEGARPRLRVGSARGQALPLLCRHCRLAPCLDACPAGAMQREGERVFVDAERCVGCWSCVMVCPVGVVSPGAGERPAGHPTAFKCDGCPQEPDPPCVAACPTGALLAEEQLQPATTATARRQALAARLAGPRSEADAELT